MAEFFSQLLSILFLLKTQPLEYFHRKHEQFMAGFFRKLSYTRNSWHLIFFVLRFSGKSTLVVILGRFLETVIPSMQLRIKSGLLNLVSSSKLPHADELGTRCHQQGAIRSNETLHTRITTGFLVPFFG